MTKSRLMFLYSFDLACAVAKKLFEIHPELADFPEAQAPD